MHKRIQVDDKPVYKVDMHDTSPNTVNLVSQISAMS